jgi:hypothetical protein
VVAQNGTAIDRLSYDALLARAASHGEWRTLTLNIPAGPDAPTVRIGIDEGNGGQPELVVLRGSLQRGSRKTPAKALPSLVTVG